MKKFFLTFGVACMALSTFASTRILYQQNFETASSVEDTGWSIAGGTISIASDDFGKFLELSLGQNNGRSGMVNWGQDIYMENGTTVLEDGKYNITYDFNIKTTSNNQYNSEITVFTNHAPITSNRYRDPWSQAADASYWQTYLFDMAQDPTANTVPMYAINGGTTETEKDGAKTYAIDYSDLSTLALGEWYTVNLDVDTNNRTVEYSVTSVAGGDILKSGTLTVPEKNVLNDQEISMYAEGIFALLARYQTTFLFDNITISCETSYDYANAPTVALTGLGQNEAEEEDPSFRKYTITFLEGETLHVIGTDGKEITVEYDETEDGAYTYTTSTSGTIKAWTTVGDAKSPEVTAEVDCNPVVLPEATVTVSAVSEGYAKTYTLTVNNADVPLRPTIFINYEFTGKSGEIISKEGEASGCSLNVTEKGTLKVTTAAFGYQSTSITEVNDLAFETGKVWDFARMSKEEIAAAGFPSEFTVVNSDATSGFNNWTARKRLYYVSTTETEEVTNEDGSTSVVAKKIYPFGFVDAESTTNVLEYSLIDRAAIPETKKGEIFEGLTIFPERGKVDEGGLPNVGMIYHVGLYNDQTKNNNNNIYIHDLDESDFVVVNAIDNYGSDSNHPEVATDDEYYKLLAGTDEVFSVAKTGKLNEETNLYDVTYVLYRIQKAVTKITIFKAAGKGGSVEGIASEINGDNYWYSIDGVRVAQPTRPGLYIHNGKKIIVK